MKAKWSFVLVVGMAFALGAGIGLALLQPALGGGAGGGGGASGNRYTVVETEATNLIVTDNKTNILYFYTIDRDQEIGSDLKLRGSLDLNDVGKAVMKPHKAKDFKGRD